MSWKKLGIIIALVGTLATVVTVGYALKSDQRNEEQNNKEVPATSAQVAFEEAGIQNEFAAGAVGESWPGEIVSFSTTDIHPLSEGIITEISVRVGQKVVKGQTIGVLSAPPASVEQAMAAADKVQMLIKARTNAESTETLTREQIDYLNQTKQSIAPVRDTNIAAASKETDYKRQLNANAAIDYDRMKKELDASVELVRKERDSVKVKVGLVERSLRALLEQTLEKNLRDLTTNYSDYRLLPQYWSIYYKSTVVNQERNAWENTLSQLIRKLQSGSMDGLDDATLRYASALRKYSLTLLSGENMMPKEIMEMQTMAREQEKMIIDMVNELYAEQAMLQKEEAEVSKMIAMRESELTKAKLMIATSAIETEQSEAQTAKMTSEAQFMYLERKKEIDEKIAMLKRELEMARSEVKAAQAAYDTFISQLASQRIVAQSDGVVSGIYKNVGDFVMPSDTVASLTAGGSSDSFVRFRVSSDAQTLQTGDRVIVSRPGFPFEKMDAVVRGVGTALSEQGAFVAEAEFVEKPDWPVKSLVRITRPGADNLILAPFTAVKWDEEGAAHMKVADQRGTVTDRTVRVGRAIGDRVEIVEGLARGERYAIRYDDAEHTSSAVNTGEEGKDDDSRGGHQHGE